MRLIPGNPGISLFVFTTLVGVPMPSPASTQDWGSPEEMRKPLCIAGPNPGTCTTEELQKELMKTIWLGRKDDALRIIGRLKDVNISLPPGGRTPLSLATQYGHVEVVMALLKKGADPLANDKDGRPFLYMDIMSAYSSVPELPSEVVECARLILEKSDRLGRLPGKPPLDASVVFWTGARKPSLELLRLFLKYGADPVRTGWYSYDGSPLDVAIAKGNLEAIRLMVGPGGRIGQVELDRRAFEALMNRKFDLLSVLRSGGADPARYMNGNPKVLSDAAHKGGMEALTLLLKNGVNPDVFLFDAVRPEGNVETLEFLLKNGANPNAVNMSGTPIFETLDPEKLQLLFKYGADPNFRKEAYGYTALSYILFMPRREVSVSSPSSGGKPRIYTKAFLVKLFLDHGADPNAEHGERGLFGALGNTRTEDKDVVNLLIERGATLTNRVDPRVAAAKGAPRDGAGQIRGALTIAIDVLEREDLALALLARDRRVGTEDRHALLAAVRRGWSEVAQALLRSGADPNVADDQGVTPLAIAERRRDKPIIRMLVAAGATPPLKPAPRYEIHEGGEFASTVAAEIDGVVFFDPPRFGMGAPRETTFELYGNRPHGQGLNQNLEVIRCERAASFMIIAHANDAGGISAGVCDQEAARLHALAASAKKSMDVLFDQFAQQGMKVDRKALASTGWIFEKKTGPNRSEIYYFPVIVVGHGILSAPTAVLVSEKGDKAVIVQASVMNLCGERYEMQNQTPLCIDTKEALTEIAQRLFAKFR